MAKLTAEGVKNRTDVRCLVSWKSKLRATFFLKIYSKLPYWTQVQLNSKLSWIITDIGSSSWSGRVRRQLFIPRIPLADTEGSLLTSIFYNIIEKTKTKTSKKYRPLIRSLTSRSFSRTLASRTCYDTGQTGWLLIRTLYIGCCKCCMILYVVFWQLQLLIFLDDYHGFRQISVNNFMSSNGLFTSVLPLWRLKFSLHPWATMLTTLTY